MSRPKGFAPWSPKPEVEEVLDNVRAVLDEYRNFLPMTVRQIFYRLVGAYGYEKTEKAYKRLAEYLVRARRARMIPFAAIRDDGTVSHPSGGWDSPEEFLDYLKGSADTYGKDRMLGQEMRVEVWCEAAGMAPQLARVARDYGITVYSSGGFGSVTQTYEVGMRAARSKLPTYMLHIGDFDPSGVSLYEAMSQDSGLFAIHGSLVNGNRALGSRIIPVRVALTYEQVVEHGIPTAPPKASDTRSVNWLGETAQAEAMPPDLLAETLRRSIEAVIDLRTLSAVLEDEEQERELLKAKLDAIDWGD